MDVSFPAVLKQNTRGQSEGFPVGVPRSYNWFRGWNNDGQKSPPADFTAVEGWGQVYDRIGAAPYASPAALVQVANAKTYVHLKVGGWTLVQDQTGKQLVGGHFIPSFANNAGYPMKMVATDGDVVNFVPPPNGHNNHFWHGARGTYPAGSVDAVYVQMDIKVNDEHLDLIAMVGADWWRDARAPFLQDHSNNPGAGSSNWVKLSTNWSTFGFYSSSAVMLHADPPPPLVASARQTPIAMARNAEPEIMPSVVSFAPDTAPIGDSITSADVLTLAGTAPATSSVRIFNGSVNLGVATANDAGIWTFVTGRLANGNHNFIAKIDAVVPGNELVSLALKVKVEAGSLLRPSRVLPPDRKNKPIKSSMSAMLPITAQSEAALQHTSIGAIYELMFSVAILTVLAMAGLKRRSGSVRYRG